MISKEPREYRRNMHHEDVGFRTELLMIIRTDRTPPQTHGSFFAKGKNVPGAVGERLQRWISEQKGDKSMADGRVGSGI